MLHMAAHATNVPERHSTASAMRLKNQLAVIARQARAGGFNDLAVFVELAELAADDAVRSGH